MSQDNVEIAKRAVAAFNATDIQAFAALTTVDFEWFPSMSPIENEAFVGVDGIRSYFDSSAAPGSTSGSSLTGFSIGQTACSSSSAWRAGEGRAA